MGFAHSHDHSHGHAGPAHSHGHGHGHGHSHAPKDFGPAFAIGVALNTVFVVVEAAAGWLYDSMALLADAGHNLSDVLALLLAWAASEAAKRPPQGRFTYGFKSSTILAALANALLLAIAVGAILLETAHRLFEPSEPQGAVMAIVAGIGVAINSLTALLFMRGQEDLNIKGAYLHMAADALVSLGVVVAGLAIWWSGIALIDPLASLAILAVIAWATWGLARDSVKLGLNAAPAGIDVEEVRRHLGALDGVTAVHDLHVWPMSTTETALTAHLVMPRGEGSDAFLRDAARSLRARFGIGHSTIQVERDETAACEHPC
ncbi:cation diffusion facilitator family transporter [Erythrobacter sp. HL-111]|uniref:cation diffusion facilitator family transporter n=1 Tax=Erythrobacter sp. HL-111 TaxID=1798193 RepID=UPI0006D9B232|nr:cation diffusion facilitator family transporter [Erythrobacter sp. HL-111]KPP91247.1 MAG: RND-type cobalt-zinc-cadmium efflux pump associated metal detoxification protein CzcD [Erythrobacteraceae bacterium HL-111]SDT07606.1 cobalt-zinc-cadmium efflux system protein [Erythrobacter sp. HL-111]